MSRANKLLRVNACFMLQAGVAVALMKSGCVRKPHSLMYVLQGAEAQAGLVKPNGKGQTAREF